MSFIRSKRLLALFLVLALVFGLGLSGCGPKDDPAPPPADDEVEVSDQDVLNQAVSDYFANMPDHIYKIPEAEFVDLVKMGEDMIILDIRQADVYEEGHIVGAINAPWGPGMIPALDNLPGDKPVMVYCYTGQTAGQAVALLNFAGIQARSVNLGWNLGIAKVEGVEEVITQEAADYPEVTPVESNPIVKAAVVDYLNALEDVKGTMFANFIVGEEDAKDILDANDPGVMFLSVRSAADYAEGHIAGADNIPFGKGMHEGFGELPEDKKIIVYCYTGQTAGQVVAGLRIMGFDAVSLRGGTGMPSNAPSGWVNQGYPLVQD